MENTMKKGLIKFSDILIKEQWERFYIFFKDFRPTHMEFKHWENNTWYYYGISNLFDESKEGDEIPQYDLIFTKDSDGNITYEFKRF